ncbi:modular serine protease [Procambarus clarkii]|uniref:modular serine protease n=1 Tax=Procambarus clarkii TaxID=6728 RepID=UPI0037448153
MLGLFFLTAFISMMLPRAASQCLLTQVMCDGRCVEACDGVVECADGADETKQLCSNTQCRNDASLPVGDLGNLADVLESASSSATAKFKCDYGACIPLDFLCNGHTDCWDKSDETAQQCAAKKCTRREFRCDYGACIRRLWSCNGYPNCADSSDETPNACKNQKCTSTKFQCKYGACIDGKKKCDGTVHCIDSSDETKELCGPQHTFVTTESPKLVTPASPTPPTPPPPTPAPPPPPTPASTFKPGITYPVEPPVASECKAQGMCECPTPYEHFCVPCNNVAACSGIVSEVVCSLQPVEGSSDAVFIEVLSCGAQLNVNVEGIVRTAGGPLCGIVNAVPVLGVVMAECWGTIHLAQCQADGLWHPYGTNTNNAAPTETLCQSTSINSQLCGRRPRYINPEGRFILQAQPQWPWLAGLYNLEKYICTATIISSRYLLTAAHCVTRTQETLETLDVRNLRVQLLSPSGTPFKDYVTKIHLYPGYVPGTRPSHDLAVVRVEKPMVFSHKVYPACVLSEYFPEDEIAATFRHGASNNYQWELIIQKRDIRCRPTPHRKCGSSLTIDKDQFCGINPDNKQFLTEGSSGGPYLVNIGNDVNEKWAVAGIVSSSYSESSCPHDFTIFNHVLDFWPWISRCVHNGECARP